MSLTREPLVLASHPVDLRLWVQEVILGWKTPAQVQAEIRADSQTLLARRIASLSLTRELCNLLIYELDFQKIARVVVFSQFRDVLLDLQQHGRDRGVNMVTLFAGTPEQKRERRIRKFQRTMRYPILGIHLSKDWPCPLAVAEIDSQEWIFVEGGSHGLFHVELPGRIRVCKNAQAQ